MVPLLGQVSDPCRNRIPVKRRMRVPLAVNCSIPTDCVSYYTRSLSSTSSFSVTRESGLLISAQSRLPRAARLRDAYQAAWLLNAIACMDLTTLADDDTPDRVRRLCAKSRRPLSDDIVAGLGLDRMPRTGAVCVCPTMIGPAVHALGSRAFHRRRVHGSRRDV